MNRYLVMIAASLASFGVFAQDPMEDPSQTPTSFEALDKDSDQRLSASEAEADQDLAQNFAAADSDQDGYLSQDEYDTYNGEG